MGIKVEFNSDLALRRCGYQGRFKKECLPERLKVGEIYDFLKEGQRNYWLEGEIPLLETKGNEKLSRPLASIKILEATHFLEEDKRVFTKGKYAVLEVYDPVNKEIHFEGMQKAKKKGG